MKEMATAWYQHARAARARAWRSSEEINGVSVNISGETMA